MLLDVALVVGQGFFQEVLEDRLEARVLEQLVIADRCHKLVDGVLRLSQRRLELLQRIALPAKRQECPLGLAIGGSTSHLIASTRTSKHAGRGTGNARTQTRQRSKRAVAAEEIR